jgi:sialic acid synthase SpsE
MIQLSKPPKNKPGIYNTDLTAGSLKLPESRIVADLLLRNVGPEEWKQAIYSENVLQSKTPETSRRLANLIRRCLQTMEPPLWKLVRDGKGHVAMHAALAAAVKHSQLLGDFLQFVDAEQYRQIGAYAASRGLHWFASPWDVPSVGFLQGFDTPVFKVASACLTDDELLVAIRNTGKPVIMSTGMSTLEEIDHAVSLLDRNNLILGQATSTYPCKPEELNLRAIAALRERFGVPVGYSGHETGLQTTVAAVALGAVFIERHITLDRAMWGTDHAASVEPGGLERLVRDIRLVESSLGDGTKIVYESEVAVKKKLRRIT